MVIIVIPISAKLEHNTYYGHHMKNRKRLYMTLLNMFLEWMDSMEVNAFYMNSDFQEAFEDREDRCIQNFVDMVIINVRIDE